MKGSKTFPIIILLLLGISFLHAQEWEELVAYESQGNYVSITSEFPNPSPENPWQKPKYGAVNLFDGDYTTAWVVGMRGKGVGEAAYISVPINCKTINIHNGFGESASLFGQNNRVKRLKISCYVGINPVGYVTEVTHLFKIKAFDKILYIELKDIDSMQTVPFPFQHSELQAFEKNVKEDYFSQFSEPIYQMVTFIKLEFDSVLIGTKFTDTGIGEIFFSNSYVADYRNQPYTKVNNIYTDEANDSRLLIDTPSQNGIVILNDPESVFQVVEVSHNKHWATVIRMPAYLSEGRLDTDYLIINTHLSRVMNYEIEKTAGISLFSPFILSETHGDIVLEHAQGEIRLR